LAGGTVLISDPTGAYTLIETGKRKDLAARSL
jgi:hypothetical protein